MYRNAQTTQLDLLNFDGNEDQIGITANKVFSETSTAARKYPGIIKYMGSKARLLDTIKFGIAELNTENRPLVDLFAGACAVSAGLGNSHRIISNDIQQYSSVIANAYLTPIERIGQFDIVSSAQSIVDEVFKTIPSQLSYPNDVSIEEFNEIEVRSRSLIDQKFYRSHHLFTRNYAGTYWSAEQCIWIDAIREVLDMLHNSCQISTSDFNFGLTCLLSAMAYTSQSTGHFGHYRDAKTIKSMNDILKYRRSSLSLIFSKKFRVLHAWNQASVHKSEHQISTSDFKNCLSKIEKSVVYADPPYSNVHYSRFYHAIETLVKYDYPELQRENGVLVKGRYRKERHQSPFCIKSQVTKAFCDLFKGVKHSESDLLLSYSNTARLNQDLLLELPCKRMFGK